MSWSVSTTISGDSPQDGLEMTRDAALAQNPTADDQFEIAKDVAYAIIASSACGGADKRFHVTMSGHANPSHEPRPNYANDMITVSVVQA